MKKDNAEELFDSCTTRDEFVLLLQCMRNDLVRGIENTSPESLEWDILQDTYWNKTDIASFLDAISAWLSEGAEVYFTKNHGGWPNNPWTILGEVFMAGAVRE
jgi:hypothetical protein